ncbi:MAG TPA: alpha-L-glutamate ligase-like protein [Gammaproteobacteria bacterium]|nr:alpha-L-glutamate ligase-like protein [Gammaproteobacteria bacterium]
MRALLDRLFPARAMREIGVLGMNGRNINYISRYNSRQLYPLVDDKLKTKQLALEHGVTTPELIGVISAQHDVRRIAELVKGHDGFCIKPAKGSGGKGILVVARVEDGRFFRTNGTEIPLIDLQRHLSNVLAGLFSLGGAPDVAIIEALIRPDEVFRDYSYAGVPDIRVVVFQGVPVMAMVRLSCAASNGKANLHQGAVGVGLAMDTGRAVCAVQRNRPVFIHPDTGHPLDGLVIPHWHALLELSCACADMTGLGYLGVDLVMDRERGPMLLELNARPGLAIQMANGTGLLPRLRRVEAEPRIVKAGVRERVAFAARHFGTRPAAIAAVA